MRERPERKKTEGHLGDDVALFKDKNEHLLGEKPKVGSYIAKQVDRAKERKALEESDDWWRLGDKTETGVGWLGGHHKKKLFTNCI